MISKYLSKVNPVFFVLCVNGLEFMDLRLYTHFGWLIKKIFFPDWSNNFLEIFRLSNIYLLAPLSCLVWAYIGDFKGRHIVILSSSLLMAVSSLSIIFLPVESYPIICAYVLIVIRIFQGLALGGEPMAAYLYLIESGKKIRKLTFWNCVTAATEGVGGLLALFIGSGVLYFLGEQHWRYIFVFITIFIVVILIVRLHLVNTKEYNEYLSDQKIYIWEKDKINEIFKFRNRNIKWNNYAAGFLIWLAYPSMFVICYLHISPFICTKMGGGDQYLIWYNVLVTLGEHCTTLLIFWIVTRWTSFNLRVTGLLSTLLGLSIISYCLLNLETLSIYSIFIGQVALMSLVNYCWITPDIFKTFSVIGRYTTMARTWSIARLINFPICIFILNFAITTYGLGKGSLYILLVINFISLFSYFIMRPYSSYVGE